MKLVFVFVTALLLSATSFAGNGILFKNLKLKRVGINLGAEKDLITGNIMSHNYFNSLVDHQSLNADFERFVDTNFSKYSGVCENPHIRINLAYELPKANRELNLSFIGVFNRIDGVYYDRQNNSNGYEYLSYDMYSNEFALEASYVFKKELNLVQNIFGLNLYGLVGTNLGYQFNNVVTVNGTEEIRDRQFGARINATEIVNNDEFFIEETDYFNNSYRASNAINQRAFAGVGFGLLFFNRVELGMNGRFGYGYRFHFSNDFTYTNLQSFDFTAKWVLK